MTLTKKEKNILEKYFSIYESNYSNGVYYELESWTDGGVDMIITLPSSNNKTVKEQLNDYIENFDIDEEIDLYREDKRYKEAFTIRESLKDFENWLSWLKDITNELKN